MPKNLARNATIVTGRISAETGGPVATIGNIKDALTTYFNDVAIVAMPAKNRNSQPVPYQRELTIMESVPDLLRRYHQSVADSQLVVIVGVWHPLFGAAILHALLTPDVRVVLVPTNSLMPWDWAKHKWIKRLIRPFLWLLAGRIDVLMTASRGERSSSWPSSRFRNSVVVPHAVRIDADITAASESVITRIAFAARIEPQKDLTLFLNTAAILQPDYGVDVFGEGSETEMEQGRATARKLGLTVTWHGWTDKQRLLEHLAEGSVLLITSKAENFCHSAAETASIGAPVVVVDRIASAEDLSQSPLITTATADPHLLADEVRAIAASPNRPVDDAKRFAQAEWSPETYHRRWATVLDDLGFSCGSGAPDK